MDFKKLVNATEQQQKAYGSNQLTKLGLCGQRFALSHIEENRWSL